MPTEHEYKYVISMGEFADGYHEEMLPKCLGHQVIRQGYLAFSKGMTTRIRSITQFGKQKWFLTFKQKVGDRVIEIEKKIDKRDGKDLWSVCVGKLKKDRYILDNKGVKWELDFFKKGDHLYFILAEVELEEGSPRPDEVPDFLKEFIVYEVPLTDDRFSNKRLGDVEYATNLYRQLVDGDNDDGHTDTEEAKGL